MSEFEIRFRQAEASEGSIAGRYSDFAFWLHAQRLKDDPTDFRMKTYFHVGSPGTELEFAL